MGNGLTEAGVSIRFERAEAAALDRDRTELSADFRDSRGEGMAVAEDKGEEIRFDFEGVSMFWRSSIHWLTREILSWRMCDDS